MAYTVKKLAKISGISVRTLHWYDEIGLLKPAYSGNNGYRYYEEKQMLILQQILFFKELGFTLNDIQKLLSQNDFDNLKALSAHRKVLEEDLVRINSLISTIDKTILHLEGKQTMSDKELYYGFESARQKEYEQYLVKYHGTPAEERLLECKKRTAIWDKEVWDEVKNKGDTIHKDLADAIQKGLSPHSDDVQTIIHRHYQLQNRFFNLTREVYIGLSELYVQHPDFKKFFDVYHPKMIEFLGEAMRYYANKTLS
ncbi:MAG: transcriptional regulator [Alphaproteobacteria bacterium 16-39-46]|nr:MAG: transcriptional regulator [Alphaproteobacteria bacterium 16-39-46]OZA41983.1 MAG: transcriptional regulator [Alphaproteobacteria bacterium 17-39-52]HQS84636.1 MerR family transcriptional regulator [Alphaproteobacteria bacterium]HQS94448.1 MerR family transcriptional regulator [Alphaproteobacteria bacterium]